MQSKTGQIELPRGPHAIGVMYFNRGPSGKPSGGISVQYKGPDTKDKFVLLPQEKLGSSPMKLSKARGNKTDNKTATVVPGSMVYDEMSSLAVMPVGSCDLQCQRGQRRGAAMVFNLFCSQRTEVSFVAGVDSRTTHAMVWVDQRPLEIWPLKRLSALEESSDSEAGVQEIAAALGVRETAANNETAAALLSIGFGGPRSFIMVP